MPLHQREMVRVEKSRSRQEKSTVGSGKNKARQSRKAGKAGNGGTDSPYSSIFDAIRHNDAEGVRSLLDAGVSVNARDCYGCTPLHYVVCGGQKALFELIILRGANVSLKSGDGLTPLESALLCGNFEMAEALVRIGADRRTIRSSILLVIESLGLKENFPLIPAA